MIMTISSNTIPLDDKVKNSLRTFFSSVTILADNEIIRSSKYSADIAEFICSKFYDLELCKNQRQVGFDALDIDKRKVQIKINNSSKKTNQSIGDKKQYDDLYLLVTSNSLLFNQSFNKAFLLLYKIPASTIIGDKYIAKTFIQTLTPDLKLDENFDIIK